MHPFIRRICRSSIVLLLAAAFTGCSSAGATDETSKSTEEELIAGRVGAVYTLSNDAQANEVLVFRRAHDGSLQPAARYATTGKGSGGGLGSQGAVVLSADRSHLFAVNAGSNEISVFSVQGETLFLLDTVPSGGERPISVTAHGNLVYALNAGGSGNITGFVLHRGSLLPLPGSTRPLSGAAVGPAEVAFSPRGRALVVTEKATNQIDGYRVDLESGLAEGPTVHPSQGQTPFGFGYTQRGQLVVSEAFGGADGQGAVSSYALPRAGGLTAVSASVPDHQAAPCWIVLGAEDRFAYTSNTASGSISGYSVASNGALALLDPGGRSADTGAGSKPADMALSRNGRFLYVVNGGTATVAGFQVASSGSLSPIGESMALPATAVGLAAQ